MARIRSIHPGVYTDEAWASVSIAARWLGMGICTEADDNGIFEWKPLQLKMRIFPADSADVPGLLSELCQAGIVKSFDADGKKYGALRNFCRFQRPRKPKSWFPMTDEVRSFVALDAEPASDDDAEQEPVPKKSVPTDVEAMSVPKKSEAVPQKSEKSPQMEDGGWRMEKEISPLSECAGESASVPQATRLRTRLVGELYGGGMNAPVDIARADTWVAQGWDQDICFAVMAEALTRPGARDKPLKWFDGKIRDAHNNRNTGAASDDAAHHHHRTPRPSRSELNRSTMAEVLAGRPDSRLAAQAAEPRGADGSAESAHGGAVVPLRPTVGAGFG